MRAELYDLKRAGEAGVTSRGIAGCGMAIDQFRVPAISGRQCVSAITAEVSSVPGVRQVVVNLADRTVRVEHEEGVSAARLIQAINEAGYDEVAMLV
jgi:copper chaperone CopZ